MVMSVGMRSVYALALQLDDELTAYDFKWDNAVEVNDEEGTRFFFINAFCLEYVGEDKDKWLMVFTEHHKFHVFHQEELTSWQAWTRAETTDFEKFIKERESKNGGKKESKT